MEGKEKIEKIMEREQMNSLQFASEIGIQGSTLSHILNDRNKPSLEVLKKILNRFRTISSDWLILDVGPMYRVEKHSQMPGLFDKIDESDSKSVEYTEKTDQNTLGTNTTIQQKTEPVQDIPPQIQHELKTLATQSAEVISKTVKKIIVYYTDNTFQEFDNK